MKTEIERKFIVDPTKIPNDLLKQGQEVTQAYLSVDPEIRVRIVKFIGFGSTSSMLTIKSDGLLSRKEFEIYISNREALELAATTTRVIKKFRYNVDRWEIDCFEGDLKGLWLAEIELKPEEVDMELELPEWIVREVTFEPEYYNKNLVTSNEIYCFSDNVMAMKDCCGTGHYKCNKCCRKEDSESVKLPSSEQMYLLVKARSEKILKGIK